MQKLSFMMILVNIFFIKQSHQTNLKKGQSTLWNSTDMDLLRLDLLYGYDKYTRPTYANTNVSVDLTLDIKHIQVDDITSVMTVQGILKMEWIDFRLRWDPDIYDGLESIAFQKREIWIPDIFHYNSETIEGMDHYGNVPCIVNASGNVLWKPPAQFVPYCMLNHTYWPFDNQSCEFKIGSYILSGEELRLTNDEGYKKSSEHYSMNNLSQWEIVSAEEKLTTIYYNCCPEPYHSIDYQINIRRVASSYIFIIVLPALAIVFLTLSIFWLPIIGHERFILSCVIISIIGFNFMYISICIPLIGKTIPRIVLFYIIDLYSVVAALIVSRFILGICNIKMPLPLILGYIIRSPVGKFLGIETHDMIGKQEEDTNKGEMNISKNLSFQWFEVAKALNRIFSVLYIFFFTYIGIRIAEIRFLRS